VTEPVLYKTQFDACFGVLVLACPHIKMGVDFVESVMVYSTTCNVADIINSQR
jgi:hypothetical protein